ncbi:acyl-coenzyme A thioesterase THEM4 isoform X3 [Perca flavescens]|uniref:acyl-coenzyme A thioesterase THEM4 isoform X3 n=1 Tax=Perca flavescens TaxID=8167 RepID=UPI00106DD5A4|nr:acyl-coenzyme A thioesterase THEM4-like isoform X3 [Perca flavescens]
MARSLGRICKGFQCLGSLSSIQTQLRQPSTSVSVRGTTFVRTMVQALPSLFSSKPRDFSLPNSSWGSEMMRLYEHYNSQCEVETEGGEKQEGPWRRLPSYNRLLNEEQKCACVFQAGHLLEGPPGHVHGGAIATMIDTVTGTHATILSGPVMTANLNINYRSPIPLGSTVLLESFLDKKEGRKTFISCKVTSSNGSKLHTETTALFLSINFSHLLLGE